MRYTVSQISRLVGLTPQTIREYENSGLLISKKDPHNQYRYFDADAANKAGAIRRLRNMGFSLSEIKEIYTDIRPEAYLDMIGREVAEKKKELAYQSMILELLEDHFAAARTMDTLLNQCTLTTHEAYYCLDYRRGDDFLLETAANHSLLNQWMEHSVFARNYSPFPLAQLDGQPADTATIGFATKARYAAAIGLDVRKPCYLREAALCVQAFVRFTSDLRLLPDGTAFLQEYLYDNHLLTCGQEPFLVSEISFHHNNEKMFYGNLFLPVKKR